jgi:septal ring factor EnvC (AmiA/AmiB activator)
MTHETDLPSAPAAVAGTAADAGDLTYRAAAADRAAKIAALVGQVENLRTERAELERRVDKLERRLGKAHDKLEHRADEVRHLRGELAAVLAASPRPVIAGDRGSFAIKRFAVGIARKVGLRA